MKSKLLLTILLTLLGGLSLSWVVIAAEASPLHSPLPKNPVRVNASLMGLSLSINPVSYFRATTKSLPSAGGGRRGANPRVILDPGLSVGRVSPPLNPPRWGGSLGRRALMQFAYTANPPRRGESLASLPSRKLPNLWGRISLMGPEEESPLGTLGLGFRSAAIIGQTDIPYSSTTAYLNRPYALAVDSADNVYIAEIEGHRVLKFDDNGNFKAQIGYNGLCRPDTGGICRPTGLAVAPDGQVWITEEWPERVSIFTYTTSTFSYINQLGVTWTSGSDNAYFHYPEGVAFDSAGRIYIADRRNNRVQIFSNTQAYSATLGGICGSDNYQLCQPYGLAVGSGNVLYVADTNNKRVQVYQPIGNNLVFSQSITATGLGRVTGVAVDANYIYAADRYNSQIYVFSRTGAFNSIIDGTDWFSETMDVAVNSQGEVYVADTWGPFRVMKCNGGPSWSCSPFVGDVDKPYLTDGGHYFLPTGLAVDPNDNIFLTEEGGHRLIKLNSSGVFQFALGSAGISGSDGNHFDQPMQVAVDNSDRIYVADTNNDRVQIFNSDGNYFSTLGFTATTGTDNNHFNSPAGVAVDTGGNIYVADTNNHRIQIFDSTRNYSATLGTTGISGTTSTLFKSPRGVTVDSNGNIYVADTGNYRVQIFDNTAHYSATLGVAGISGSDNSHFKEPADIAVAGDKIFVSDCSNDRVQVFGSDGTFLTTVGGVWGEAADEMRCPQGLDVDQAGNLYVADYDNQRIQKFIPVQVIYLPVILKN